MVVIMLQLLGNPNP